MRSVLLLAAAAVVPAVVGGGCGADDGGGDDGGGCSTTSDCPQQKVCDVPAGACVDEPAAGALGRFSCTFVSPQELNPNLNLGVSEVVAGADGVRYALVTSPVCVATDEVAMVQFVHVDPADPQAAPTLALLLDPTAVTAGTPFTLERNRELDPRTGWNSGLLYVGAGATPDEVKAVVTGGTVTFEARPVLGATVEGFVDLTLGKAAEAAAPDPACGDGSSGHTDCDACMDDAMGAQGCCEAPLTACAANDECVAVNGCIADCADDACIQACLDAHPGGTADLATFWNCLWGAGTQPGGACGAVCSTDA